MGWCGGGCVGFLTGGGAIGVGFLTGWGGGCGGFLIGGGAGCGVGDGDGGFGYCCDIFRRSYAFIVLGVVFHGVACVLGAGWQ